MRLPRLAAPKVYRETISAFGGLNRQLVVADGEFSAMENLTSDHYPVMAVRPGRNAYVSVINPLGLLSKKSLVWISGPDIVFNGERVPNILLSTAEEMLPKQMVSMGALLCVFPDAVYFNTENTADCGSLNASFAPATGTSVTYTMTTFSGAQIDAEVSGTEPESPENGAYWVDISGDKHSLKQYSASAGMWTTVATTYVKVECPGIGANFSVGDGVRIAGAKYNDPENLTMTEQIGALAGSHVIRAKTDDSITIVGILDKRFVQTDTEGFVVERKAPEMDYVVESKNRLWGCKYGIVDGKTVNEIYCCKLGDPKNWEVYSGIASDAWRASVGTDGAWTGAVTYGDTPIFFKSDHLHKVYPSAEGAHQIASARVRGVSPGASKSLAIVDEILYYLSGDSVCAYDGSLPVSVTTRLGTLCYTSGVGGSAHGKYYLSATDKDGTAHTLVYDAARQMWHEESPHHAIAYAQHDGYLWYIDGSTDKIMTTHSEAGTAEGPVEWRAETGVQGYAYPDHKYLSRYDLRMSLGQDARFELYIEYDSNGKPMHYGTVHGNGRVRTFVLPVPPRRCDHLRLIMAGRGDCKLYSITRILEVGSDGGIR